ncbi:MAG: rod shape-determining protein [Planctomycetia bacterium]|nr:rod shape-determining protein [Planctomycetia bacterium]
MDQGINYIGVDFGTFKTSAACSNGRREMLPTAVGWPKDHVARTMLGRDVIFGKEIQEFRLALNVVRPFERGVLKYVEQSEAEMDGTKSDAHKEAAKLLLEHVVSQMRTTEDQPIYGVIGAPSRASIKNKQVLLDAAKDAFDAVVIVSEPFTIAYGMNQLNDTLVVDIGAGTIDLCPMFGTYPAEDDQVTLSLGGDMIDEAFLSNMQAAYPEVQLTANMAREIKEKFGFVHDLNEKAIVTLTAKGRPKQYDVTKPLKDACNTIVQPIVEGLYEVIAKLDPEYQRRMLNNILLGGGGSQLRGLDNLIEQGLNELGGGKVKKVYDSVLAGASGALKLAMNMPLEYWQTMRKRNQIRIAA